MTIKLALIDDHELVLSGLYNRLEKEDNLNIVGAFTDANELLLLLKKEAIDVLIMDVMLKDRHGFDLIDQIKQLKINLPKIILISGFYETILHKRALDIGIKAFLPKETSYEELISTILNVANGNQVIPDNLLKNKANHLLTDTEVQVLKLLVDEYSNEKIAKELFISRRTVDSHVSSICAKLGVSTRVGAVREAVRLNLY